MGDHVDRIACLILVIERTKLSVLLPATFSAVHLNTVPLSVPDALNETVCGDGPMTKVPFSSVKMLTVGTGCPPVEMHVNVTFLPVDSGRIGPVIVTDSGGSAQKLNFIRPFFKPQ